MLLDRRILLLAGLAAGLALSPLRPVAPGIGAAAVALGCAITAALVRPAKGARALGTATLVLVAGVAGFLVGGERLGAVAAGAFDGRAGARVDLEGFVAAVPRASAGTTRIPVETTEGRLLIETRGVTPSLSPGSRIRAAGVLRDAPDWYTDTLRRQGITQVLDAPEVTRLRGGRAGIAGALDAVRNRAVGALTRGMADREGALALGFVLGQDDRIDGRTEERFRRSGLAHLLAVSGQNVLLLVLLAAPVLALIGIPLGARLWILIGLIAVYVPLAGAGPSIQRAGVMGAAGLFALLAGRPSSRLFALLAAAAVTLALNPLASGDPGWQLSFAAVIGIFSLAAPLRGRLAALLGPGRARGALAEGGAVTIAATLVTAPVGAHHFEAFSFAALPANLLVLPAVAPAMWLGMTVAALAQLPAAPIGALNALNEALLGYIAQVAAWFGDPAWAQADVAAPSAPVAIGTAALLIVGTRWLLRLAEARSERRATGPQPDRRRRHVAAAAGATALVALLAALALRGSPGDSIEPDALRVTVLDVGQGDSILLQPGDGAPVLVDTGPPGGAAADGLRERGVDQLAAVVVTHDEADHSGGLPEVLTAAQVDRLVCAHAGRELIGTGRGAGARLTPLAEGGEIRSGSLRLTALWPPRELAAAVGSDPNPASIVLLARWRDFDMLLTGDAEAEAVPLDPGPIDVLKVSHHGSADTGLGALLDRAAPAAAVISVGDGNPFGHPHPAVVDELRAHDVALLRTDLHGDVVIEVKPGRFAVDEGG